MIIFNYDDLSKSVEIYIQAYIDDNGYEYYLDPGGIFCRTYPTQRPVYFARIPVKDFGDYVKVRKTMMVPVSTILFFAAEGD